MFLSVIVVIPIFWQASQGAAPKGLPAPQSKPATPEWYKGLIDAGKAYYEKRYSDAAAGYAKVLAAPELPPQRKSNIYYSLGRSEAMAGNKENAVAALVNAIDNGFYDFDGLADDKDTASVANDSKIADAMKRNQSKKDAADAEAKKKTDSMRAQWDKQIRDKKTELLEKLKDEKGAGFDFKLEATGIDGKPMNSKLYEGKVAIIHIWGTWQFPCVVGIPNFVELVNKHKNDAFVMIGLNDEHSIDHINGAAEAAKVKKFATKNNIQFPLGLVTPEIFKQVPGTQSYPMTMYIDKKGKVRLIDVGYSSFENIDAIVTALLSER
ncbi:MAG: redoxin domain-containing protein [Planctomycetes bacterium]|nr:redoxin domain-containing protein [Planctomycetota bacterium]